MSPQVFAQMTIQQQEHVIKVFETKVEAQIKETDALLVFRDHAPQEVARVAGWIPEGDPNGNELSPHQRALYEATEQYFEAKHSQALMDLEELQLTVKALKSFQSPIVGATRFR